jgi:8-hydroxy-5-deazaflavin:NADPH oxidoreductase
VAQELVMKIAVLGTGMVGQAHAAKLSELKHEVTVGTHDVDKALARMEPGRMTEAFGSWIKKHPDIKVATFADAVKGADLVFEAISAEGVVAVLSDIKDHLAGKILIDITNPLDFSQGTPPRLTVSNDDSMGETIQRTLPETKVVKAFNTVNATIQVDPKSLAGGDHHLFMAGDDQAAKAEVVKIAKDYGWQNVFDLGDIKSARGMEMVFILWAEVYAKLGSAQFNFKIAQ